MKTLEVSHLVVLTQEMNDAVSNDVDFAKFVESCITRFFNRDWGDICKDDKVLNDEAASRRIGQILASYIYKKDGRKIWISTSSDHMVTTVLFPGEY